MSQFGGIPAEGSGSQFGGTPVDVAAPSAKPADVKPVQTESTAADVLESGATGLVKGGAMIAGLPGDLQAGVDWLSDKLFGHMTPEQKAQFGVGPHLPTSEQLEQLITKPFGGSHKPQTKAGEFAETIGSFAPAALAPGSAAAKVARVVAPGMLSEAGGQATKGTALEPIARAAGAIGGGLQFEHGLNVAKSAGKIPSIDELRTAANAFYDAAEKEGIVIKNTSLRNLANTIKTDIANAGVDKTLHRGAMAAFNRIAGAANTGQPITLKGVDILRRVTNAALSSQNKDERRIAYIIRDHIDDFLETLHPRDVIAKDPTYAVTALQGGRILWSRLSKAEQVESLVEKAKNRSNFSGSGFENALRTEFRKVAQNDRAMRRFTKDEQAAIKQIVRGGPAENIFRFVGRFAPQNLIHAMAAGTLGGIVGGAPGAVAAPALGAVSRHVATEMTKRNVNKLSETIRRGAPLPKGPSVLAPVGLEALSSQAPLLGE